MTSSLSLQEENTILQEELNKVEDLLATARAERDEILIRYNALSDCKVSRKEFIIFFNMWPKLIHYGWGISKKILLNISNVIGVRNKHSYV